MPNTAMKRHSLYCKEHHIICVDDDPHFLKSMNYVLSELINVKVQNNIYYRCTYLDNPLEALNLIKSLINNKEILALVICDQKMPQMKGIEFLSKVKRMAPTVSTVLLTGYAGMESAIEAINNKLLDKYLTKPIEDENDFIVSIQHLLQSFTLNQTITEQNKVIYDLFEFSNKLNSISNFKEALNYVVQHTKELLQCDRVSLLLYDEQRSVLKVAASCGIPKQELTTRAIPFDKEQLKALAMDRKAKKAKSISEIAYLKETLNNQAFPFIKVPIAYVNLISGDEPLGILNIGNKHHGNPFDDLDLANLNYIANTASISIHNHINLLKLGDAYIEVKNKAITLEHQLIHDHLTGLPNRIQLIENIKRAIDKHYDSQKKISLLLMNIKNFREINDTLGHHNGDVLLKKVAERLDDKLGKFGMLARIGADVFSFLMIDTNPEDAIEYFEIIKKTMENPFVLEGINLDVNMSFGIANYPDHGNDPNLLLQKAEIAMYAGKSSFSELSTYTPDTDQYDARRLSLISELRVAIENNELVLFYQPKYNTHLQEVDSAEALVRWNHPVHGLMAPDQFIPVAEQAGFMKPLTEWVLQEAVRQNAEWNKSLDFGKKISVAVNLSTANLLETDLPEKITKLLEKHNLPGAQLEVEVTESSVMSNPEMATDILKRISAKGVAIAIDDYGTGHSSLSYIKSLPMDFLKIDRTFVKNILLDARDMHIVKSTIELGHHLDIKVTAEGVEDNKTLNFLKSLGCDCVQGYFLSKPLPEKEFVAWMIKQRIEQESNKKTDV